MLIKKSTGKKLEFNVSRQSNLCNDSIFHYPTGLAAANMDVLRNLNDAELITITGFEFQQLRSLIQYLTTK
jgi:hypothetical protein